MSNKKAVGKIFGMILCVLSVVIFVGIFIFSSDIRGYKKLLDKYYLSIQRGEDKSFSEYYAKGVDIKLDDIRSTLLADNKAKNNDDYFKNAVIKYKIEDSKKLSNAVTTDSEKMDNMTKVYSLKIEVTINTDKGSIKTIQIVNIGKIDSKWKIV